MTDKIDTKTLSFIYKPDKLKMLETKDFLNHETKKLQV